MNAKYNIPVIIDHDPALDFEPTSFFGNIFNKFILLPLFQLIPKKHGTFLFTKSSKKAADVYQYAKTANALEILYNLSGKIKLNITDNFLDNIFTYFWHHNIKNVKAVRNRIKLVKRELKTAIKEIYSKKKVVNVFSIASGSARAVIEIMAEFKNKGIPISGRFLDLNPNAIEYSKKLAANFGVYDSITWYNDKASNFNLYINNEWQPDIIEMVGFMDYLNQEKAILLCSKIYEALSPQGIFITCNIKDNPERKFVAKILNWDMVYRNENDLSKVLVKGGFLPQNCKIIYEPYLIHGLAIARK